MKYLIITWIVGFILYPLSAHASKKCQISTEYMPFVHVMNKYTNAVTSNNKTAFLIQKANAISELEKLKSHKPEHEIEDINDLENAIKKHDGSTLTMKPVWQEIANVTSYFAKGEC